MYFKCCMNCIRRHPACHDVCVDYQKQREMYLKDKEAKREADQAVLGSNAFNRNAYAFNKRQKRW